jgi:hypothetical protein
MFLPPSCHLRVVDIWRGYWAQRLSWDLGTSVNYVSGTVNQVRNPHSFKVDLVDELRVRPCPRPCPCPGKPPH